MKETKPFKFKNGLNLYERMCAQKEKNGLLHIDISFKSA